MLARLLTRLSIGLLYLPITALPAAAQLPTDDPAKAQEKWYERERERADLVKGAFEVVRFPTKYEFKPRYQHDPKDSKRILNPDFYCNRCVREKRIPPREGSDAGSLMDRDALEILEWLSGNIKSQDTAFIEDGTFKLFSDLPSVNLKMFPNQFLKEELAELADVFPGISDKTVVLDSHKRAHLYLIRAHRLLRDFWWLAGTNNSGIMTTYPHLGSYMGMKDKQEVYLFNRDRDYNAFCQRYIGRVTLQADGQCWHLFRVRAMVMVMYARTGDDPQIQNSFFHRMMHNFIDAYRMYSFKLPAWYQMGMAHWVERRETPRFNTFCYSEGTIPQLLYGTRWLPKIKKMVLAGNVEPFVAVCARSEYGEFPPEYHMIAYSWVCYLFRLGPEKMKVFLNTMKSKDQTETLYQIQVRAFREAYGISLLEFEQGWKEWVRQVYPDQ